MFSRDKVKLTPGHGEPLEVMVFPGSGVPVQGGGGVNVNFLREPGTVPFRLVIADDEANDDVVIEVAVIL
ncbi:MAG: hypothetical protein M9926_05500 [Lentimicrobium sp.]|uniref:hypothetical protein n=1 Tax=Lentimicrobium sp. TaxID=2034841 RepID=UPI0025DFB422|nr:hypothetical protein [Lentimicrobium sp.]MCO5256199.1 hypothetical protein [Lentimicrobium sp.]